MRVLPLLMQKKINYSTLLKFSNIPFIISICLTLLTYFFPDLTANYIYSCTPDYPNSILSEEISKRNGIVMAWVIVAFCIAITVPLYFIFFFLLKVLTDRSLGENKLLLVAKTYICIIISFANAYFIITYLGDNLDAFNKYFQYYTTAIYWSSDTKDFMIQNDIKVADDYAFQGIDKKLWSGIDSKDVITNLSPHYIKETSSPIPLTIIFENAHTSTERQLIYYIPDNKIPVYTDCLYLSSVTIASLGYGDITPKWKSTKMLVSLEAILGQFLLAVGIASVFSQIPSFNQTTKRLDVNKLHKSKKNRTNRKS